jgi:hypothetical protein
MIDPSAKALGYHQPCLRHLELPAGCGLASGTWNAPPLADLPPHLELPAGVGISRVKLLILWGEFSSRRTRGLPSHRGWRGRWASLLFLVRAPPGRSWLRLVKHTRLLLRRREAGSGGVRR